nr:MAG TPA: hypothetical protein [Bacteriophage sp.]
MTRFITAIQSHSQFQVNKFIKILKISLIAQNAT